MNIKLEFLELNSIGYSNPVSVWYNNEEIGKIEIDYSNPENNEKMGKIFPKHLCEIQFSMGSVDDYKSLYIYYHRKDVKSENYELDFISL